MGKHNGKARKTGLAVGGALTSKSRRDARATAAGVSHLYTTDAAKGLQSMIETTDLEEMLSMAELADKDFSATREHAIVVSTGVAEDAVASAAKKAAAEAAAEGLLRIPRRPSWDASTTPDQLDAAERASFLEWRRSLAAVENNPHVVLTPFEKNLQVWRQLWRVVERSDAVAQVVDARDPLTYRCPDLEAYCREVHPHACPFLLLNKADLLPSRLRSAWADYFDKQGIQYAFWSAKNAHEDDDDDDDEDPRARVLKTDQLIARFSNVASEAHRKGLVRISRGSRYVVGLTGYPNVGKSSTINALFGSKKTAVAATPGKTKHFQTLNITEDLCLCDCPGLVMPRFASSRADMVAAGVIPIDRLTDIRGPVAAVARRIDAVQFSRVYGLASVSLPSEPGPRAAAMLRVLALSRGWVASSGLPDETRAGRRILKDFVDGALLSCVAPPDAPQDIVAVVRGLGEDVSEGEVVAPAKAAVPAKDNEDNDDVLGITPLYSKPLKPRRAEYKFHKKQSRGKRRSTAGDAYEDGAALACGKKGGLVRIPV